MTDSYIVQCLHCHTRFRVTYQQLSIAHGAVRCGACLHVFNAAIQLGIAPASLTRGKPQPKAARPAANPVQRPRPEEQEPASAPRPKPIAPAPATDHAQKVPHEEAHGQHDPDGVFTQAQEPDISITQWGEPSRIEPEIGTDGQNDKIVSARDDSREEPKLRILSLCEQSQLSPLLISEPTSSTVRVDEETQDIDDDLDLSQWRRPRRPWGRWLLWGTLNLLMLAALVGQYLYYNYEALVRDDAYRPWFEAVCPLVGCTLPARVDVSQIRSSNLVVRDHPRFSGALMVDAIIYNRAPFAQPFPLLELSFTDFSEKLVASRTFKPREYLAGELAGETEMPSQVPIRISLEILDPGSNAVNYRLSFHSPE